MRLKCFAQEHNTMTQPGAHFSKFPVVKGTRKAVPVSFKMEVSKVLKIIQ